MSNLIQHFIVIALVCGCVFYLSAGFFRTLSSKKGGIGNCCTKGCAPGADKTAQTAAKTRVTFMPKEFLTIHARTTCIPGKTPYSSPLARPETAGRNEN
jgi:hypothetical protein